mgnify:FL=1
MEEIVKLKEFLNGKLRNVWITTKKLSVYVRKGHHYINGKIHDTLDIANISVNKKYGGKGIGMQFINEAHETHPYSFTYIENVLNPSFDEKLRKGGWIVIPSNIEPFCYIKNKVQK